MIYRCLFTRDITNLLDKAEKDRAHSKKSEHPEVGKHEGDEAALQLIRLIIQMFYKPCIWFAPAVTALL